MDASEQAVATIYHGLRALKKGHRVFSDEELAELRIILDRRRALEESADRHDYERENE
jgi:hypothetical protein